MQRSSLALPSMPWDLPLARGRRLRLDRPLVMAILNVTPDSFSDGGLAQEVGVVERARQLLEEGADILDVGGESTRPGHVPVGVDEELARVLPAVRQLRAAFPDAVLSVDTRKGAVAHAALAGGADLVNDVAGGTDPGLLEAVREAGCALVLMRHEDLPPGDVVTQAARQLEGLVARAEAAGVPRDALLLDAGLGFGRPPGGDVEANLRLLLASPELGMGRPVVVGASRKRFLGTVTGAVAPGTRVGASVAVALLAAQHGAAVVRVHDVRDTVQALRMLEAARPLLDARE